MKGNFMIGVAVDDHTIHVEDKGYTCHVDFETRNLQNVKFLSPERITSMNINLMCDKAF
jgi:hypothetical protein